MSYRQLGVKGVTELPGVRENAAGVRLPLVVAGKLAQALVAEEEGDHDRADRLLEEACAAEKGVAKAAV